MTSPELNDDITIKLSPVKPTFEHVSLGSGLRAIIFMIPFLISLPIAAFYTIYVHPLSIVLEVLVVLIWGFLVSGIRVAAAWEQGVVLRLGNFCDIKGPGVIYVIPIIDFVKFIDVRVLTLHIPKQNVITRDNVPVSIDAVLFFKVEDPQKAVISIQDYKFAISQYAQNSLRDVVGGLTLDEVLTEREKIQIEICHHIQEKVKEWGMMADSIRIQDIEMPEDLKRMMSRQASAEREKRATIIKAEGDKMAAKSLSEAAEIMIKTPGALQLRGLQTIDGLGSSPSNTVVIFPSDFMEIMDTLNLHIKQKTPSAN